MVLATLFGATVAIRSSCDLASMPSMRNIAAINQVTVTASAAKRRRVGSKLCKTLAAAAWGVEVSVFIPGLRTSFSADVVKEAAGER